MVHGDIIARYRKLCAIMSKSQNVVSQVPYGRGAQIITDSHRMSLNLVSSSFQFLLGETNNELNKLEHKILHLVEADGTGVPSLHNLANHATHRGHTM